MNEIGDLKHHQAQIQEAYHRFSQQKEFREILTNQQSTLEEKSIKLIEAIEYASTHQKHIEDEFIVPLSAYFTCQEKLNSKHATISNLIKSNENEMACE